MKPVVFVSSIVDGFREYRQAAQDETRPSGSYSAPSTRDWTAFTSSTGTPSGRRPVGSTFRIRSSGESGRRGDGCRGGSGYGRRRESSGDRHGRAAGARLRCGIGSAAPARPLWNTHDELPAGEAV